MIKPTSRFHQWLDETPGPWRIGQLAINPDFVLTHVNDAGQSTKKLTLVEGWKAWRQIIFANDAGDFRPLKASPDFAHGWRLGPLDFDDLVLALQFAYPALIAEWAFFEQGKLEVTEWQQTAERQTGRFKVVATLGEERLREIVEENCLKGCLKRRLWEPLSETSPPAKNEIPLLCPEACNLLVGKAREKIKGPMD